MKTTAAQLGFAAVGVCLIMGWTILGLLLLAGVYTITMLMEG